jgi:hypothetical protein
MKQFFLKISFFYLFLLVIPTLSEAKMAFIRQDSVVTDSLENNVFLLDHEYRELRGMKRTAFASLSFLILTALIIVFSSELFVLWAVSAAIALLLSLSTLGKTRKFNSILKNMDETNLDYDLVKSSINIARIARVAVFFPILFLLSLFIIDDSEGLDIPLTTIIGCFSIIAFLIGNYFLFKDEKNK